MPRINIRWTASALRDVARLHRFLAGRNASAANRAVATIRAGVGILADHPEIGRPIDDVASEFREWLVEFAQGAYVLLYRYEDSQIVILAVRHGREAGY